MSGLSDLSDMSGASAAGDQDQTQGRRRRRRPTHGCLAVGAVLGVLAFAAVMTTTLLTVAIWPGEAKLTAPLFCPDDKPDAFVVVDSYSVQPGETSYNFTLYCMGPRGEVEDAGFLWPCAVLTLGHAALIVVIAVALVLLVRHRHRRRRRQRAPADQPVGNV